MWEILLELLEFLGFIGLKKKKKKKQEMISVETDDSIHQQVTSGEAQQEGGSECSACHRAIKEGAIYELGKVWCSECYKIHVLKMKSG